MKIKNSFILICLLLFSCSKHDQLYKGDWGVEVLEINGRDLQTMEVFNSSIFQPTINFSNTFSQKELNLKIDTLLFSKCNFTFTGKDSITVQNCSYSDLNNTYSFDLKKDFETNSRSEYSLIMKNNKSYIQLKQTNIDFTLGAQ